MLRHVQTHHGMPRLMVRRQLFLIFRHHHRPALGPHHHLVLGVFEINHGDKAPPDPCGSQRRLIDQIGQIGPGKARRAARDDAQIDIGAERGLARVNAKDLLAPLDIGVGHLHLTVKPAGAQQRRVQHIGAVGGGNDDDALIRLKSVHFDQQLVQRLFPLVIAAAITHATRPANRVDLINEHDAGGGFLGLFKHVAHPGCADADKHFHEIRAGNGKERHPRLTRNRAGEQGFPRTGRADQQRPFGDFPAQPAEFLRVAQELDDLFQLVLGLINPGNIVKRHAAMLFRQKLGARLAKAHRAATATALHPVHEEYPDADQHQERQPQAYHRKDARLFLWFNLDRHLLGQQHRGHVFAFGLDGQIGCAILALHQHPLAIQRHRRHFAFGDIADKIGIGD